MYRDRGAADPATELSAGALTNLNRAMHNTSIGGSKTWNWLGIHSGGRSGCIRMQSRSSRTISRRSSDGGLLVQVGVPAQLRRSHALGVPKADVSPHGGAKKTRRRRPAGAGAGTCPAADATGAQKNPLKKAVSTRVSAKKQLRRRVHVLFSAAIHNCAAAQQRARSFIRGVAQYGEKG